MTKRDDVLEFWFDELTPKQWWQADDKVDRMIHRRFGEAHKKAAAGELWQWRHNATGSLAEIIVLDQF